MSRKLDCCSRISLFVTKEENTLEIVAELQKICPVWVTNIITIEDNFKMITDFGQLFNCRTESQKWNDKIDFAWVILKLYQRHAGKKSSVFYLEKTHGCWIGYFYQ
jgi:ABC-type Fe3+-hydroxamate transport system substrate-binding protein